MFSHETGVFQFQEGADKNNLSLNPSIKIEKDEHYMNIKQSDIFTASFYHA